MSSIVRPSMIVESTEVINSRGESMIFSIREDYGLFTAVGDYGTYSYTWSSPGPDGLKKFLGRIQYDYALGKLSPNGGMAFSFSRSIETLDRYLRNEHKEISDEQRRSIIKSIEYCELEQFYITQLRLNPDLQSEDIYEFVNPIKVPDPICVRFWNEFYIPFVASYMPDHQLREVGEFNASRHEDVA